MESEMKALTWHGKSDIRCETVPDPKIQNGRDAIIKTFRARNDGCIKAIMKP